MNLAEKFKRFFERNQHDYLMILEMVREKDIHADPFPGTANCYHSDVPGEPVGKDVPAGTF